MIEFRDMTVHGPFRYFWLKYVTGVNLNVHCARCLKGEYSDKVRIAGTFPLIQLDESPASIVYLCGVALPYNWSKNFHLALRQSPGERFAVNELGVSMTVHNAVPLPITMDAVEAIDHPKRRLPRYHTCRNWQFANFLEATGLHLTQQ